MLGEKEKGGTKPGRGMLTIEWARSGRPSGVAIRMEISPLDYSLRPARVVSIPNCRILEASTKRGREVPSLPVGSPYPLTLNELANPVVRAGPVTAVPLATR